MEKPSTSVILGIFIAIIALSYTTYLDVFLHPTDIGPYAGAFILSIVTGIIVTIIIVYLWEKQAKMEEAVKRRN
jgi:uncharacterized membrane protein (DUF106 family)